MAWLAQLFRPKVELANALVRAVEAWRALPESRDSTAIDEARFIVLDVETSGLDPRRDRLLSIGAVEVERMHVAPSEAFSVIVRNQYPSTRENVAVHGLTPTQQAAGEIPEEALVRFLEFVGKSPCVAFHAHFDRTVLGRALRSELGVRLSNPWIDVARLAPILVPEARLVHGGLDDWLAYFRLRAHTRHDAVHDAHATAEIFLILLARAGARGISTLAQLRAAAHMHERITTG
jgi:DNA polymerase-3 subunit epsilon